MGQFNTCNYCFLELIKKQNPEKEVKVIEAGDHKICTLQVWVDGQETGVWFAAITDHCVCERMNNK